MGMGHVMGSEGMDWVGFLTSDSDSDLALALGLSVCQVFFFT
jgi:hypothetical protein